MGSDGGASAAGPHRGWALLRAATASRRGGMVLGALAGLCWTAGKVSVGLLVQRAVDRGIEADDLGALRRWTAALAGAALVVGVCTGVRRYLAFREARWIEADLRERIFAHLQSLHFGFHDRAHAGDLMSRANTDLQQIQALLVMVPLTISNAVTVLAVTVILLRTDPVLTGLALGSLPFLNVLSTRFSRRLHPSVLRIQQELAQLAGVVEESVAGVRVVKGFGAEGRQAAGLAVAADDLYDASMAAARVRSRFLPALELLPNLGLVATLGYGGHQVLEGGLTLGELVAFNVYVVMLIWPLRMLGMIIAQAQRSAAAAARVAELLDTAPAVVGGSRPLPPGGGEVRFEGVRFAYGDDLTWTPFALSVQVASVCRSSILRQVSATSAGVR